MTWPEVEALLSRTDMVIIPVPAIEQHGPQLPIGTDYYTGEEQAKLSAQRTDVLVAPVLLPGISPYHMEFPGTIALSSDTVQRVYFEAVQSLIRHGFRRFLLLTSHRGNQSVSGYIIDRINQETPGIAVELTDAAAPFLKKQDLETQAQISVLIQRSLVIAASGQTLRPECRGSVSPPCWSYSRILRDATDKKSAASLQVKFQVKDAMAWNIY